MEAISYDIDIFKNIRKEYEKLACENNDGTNSSANSRANSSSNSSANLRASNIHDNICSCGSILIKDILNYTCNNCGLIKDDDFMDEEFKDQTSAGRLRIVGPSSNFYQKDLYRSGTPATSETQKAQILDFLISLRNESIKSNKLAISLSAIQSAAEYYNSIQRNYVKRNENKKLILAECLKIACRDENFVPSDADLAEFMQLKTKGIAKGENFVRAFAADGNIVFKTDQSSCRPEIETIFMQLGFYNLNEHGEEIEDKYKTLKNIVEKIVTLAEKHKIANKSIRRSKVAGATYEVLRRCKDNSLIPKIPPIQHFYDKKIRKNTIENVTKGLYCYHSVFEPIYIEYGLDSGAIVP